MLNYAHNLLLMKRTAVAILLSLALTANIAFAEPALSPDRQLVALTKEIQEQQTKMAENQAKIEARLAAVTEAVRVAKIYSSRGGR